MRVLITGATGFIGGRLVDRLLAERPTADISCLVKRPSTARELANLFRLQEAGVRIIEGDLGNTPISTESLGPLDFVFHLAANIDPAAPASAHRVNDVGTANLLSWLGESLRGVRIVYTSSIAVLDRNRPADGPLNESSPCVPRTEYGRSKLRGEQIIQSKAQALGYEYTICRLATVYGPGAKTDGLFHRLFTLTAKHSLLGRLNWPGRTSIVHVDDVTAIMFALAQRPEAMNEIYCIANPDAPTVGALAAQIAQLTPESVDTIELPKWVWGAGRWLAWSRTAQLFGAAAAQTLLWRLTLILDDGFWFDTSKLQSIWRQPPKDLIEGLSEMMKYL